VPQDLYPGPARPERRTRLRRRVLDLDRRTVGRPVELDGERAELLAELVLRADLELNVVGVLTPKLRTKRA
jgi:hypothetical protein